MRIFVVGGGIGEGIPEGMVDWAHRFGKALRAAGHQLLVCSPFPDVVDALVVEGMGADGAVHVHHPRSAEISGLWAEKCPQALHSHYPSIEEGGQREAWAFAALSAIEQADVVVVVGGRSGRLATLAFRTAELRGKPVLPISRFGGAGEAAFRGFYYRIKDQLGFEGLQIVEKGEAEALVELLPALASTAVGPSSPKNRRLNFFISYARGQADLADVVEVTLRRRDHLVFRDESEFSPSAPLPQEIRDWLHRADVVVVLWSQAYACSPWCFDEVELALERLERGACGLWLLRLDETRIVPRRARQLPYFDARTREQVRERVEMLLLHPGNVGQSRTNSATASTTASNS